MHEGHDTDTAFEEQVRVATTCPSSWSAWPSPASDDYPDGPACYEDTHAWPQHMVDRIGKADPSGRAMALLRKNFKRNIFLTTHYSGMGTAEMAIGLLETGVFGYETEADMGSTSRLVHVHAASEVSLRGQDVLCGHRGPWAPRHVFGDVCFPAPVAMQQKWKRMLATARSKVTSACDRTHASAAQRADMVSQAGTRFVQTVLTDLEGVTFCRDFKQYCTKCHKYCRRFPSVGTIGDGLLVDISGSTCVGFSPAGKRWAWLDDSAVPFLVWAWTLKSARPHIILHECVRGFDPAVLDLVLNFREPLSLYAIASVVFSPTDLGLPVSRARRYTLCMLMPSELLVEYTYTNLAAVAFRALKLNGSVYFQASATELDEMNQTLAASCHLPLTNGGKRWPWSALLRTGEYRRLQEALQRKGTAVAFCSISQSPNFMTLGEVVPTLVTNSMIYRMSDKRGESRPATASEYLAMQNIPALLSSTHSAARHFAFHHLLEAGSLRLSHCRLMAGNGMNLAAVGSVLCFALASIDFPAANARQ